MPDKGAFRNLNVDNLNRKHLRKKRPMKLLRAIVRRLCNRNLVHQLNLIDFSIRNSLMVSSDILSPINSMGSVKSISSK